MIYRTLRWTWLPVVLVVFFVLQTLAFNAWTRIYPADFIGRLTFVTASLGVALFGPALLFRRRASLIYLGVTSSLVAVVFASQYLYHAYSNGLLQASAIFYAGQTASVTGTIKNLLDIRTLFFLLGPLLVLVAYALNRRGPDARPTLSWTRCVAFITALLTVFSSGYAFALSCEAREWGTSSHLYSYSKLYDVNMLVGKVGVINYSLMDAANFALRTRAPSQDDIKTIADWNAERKPELPPGREFGIAKGRNLILLQVESLEHGVIGKTVGGQDIAPNLNRLANEGLYFPNYFAPNGPGNTADAEFSTLNSLYPLPNEVAFIGHAFNAYHALPHTLADNGYRTATLHGDVPGFWNRANIYPRLGYQTIISKQDYGVTRPIGFEDLGDEDFLLQSIPKLQSLQRPFMATLITLSSHTPFELPDDLKTLPVPEDESLTWIQKNYLHSIHFTDKAIGELIDGLKETGLYDESVIAIFGDHGSYTNVDDALDGATSTIPSDMRNNHVPLIILAPHTGLTGTIDAPTSHLDLFPTLASLLGIHAPTTALGQDALNAKHPVVVWRNPTSGTIRDILTPNSIYTSSPDGIFENGTCEDASSTRALPVQECRAMFDRENRTVEVSDLVVRYNLLHEILTK